MTDDGIPNTFSWRGYKRAMKKFDGSNTMFFDLSKIGINKKVILSTLKEDEGLSKQLSVFGFREPLNWKAYHDFVDHHDIVLDIGANIGLFSILSSNAKELICVEPVRACHKLLQRNLNNNDQKAIIIDGAIGQDVKIEVASHVNLSKVSEKGVSVASFTLAEICDTYKPTLLRMDVEGYEYEIFKNGIPDCVEKICLEFHTALLDPVKAADLLDIFKKHDFKISIMIEDLPLRLYPYYRFLKWTKLIKLITYTKKNISYEKARQLIFEGRDLKYFMLQRSK